MAQNSLIQVRVDEDTKREADALFSRLGLDTPTAVRIFLKQALQQHGLPFPVVESQPETSEAHLPRREGALDFSRMTKQQIDDVLQKSWDDMIAGNVLPAAAVHENLEWKYGI